MNDTDALTQTAIEAMLAGQLLDSDAMQDDGSEQLQACAGYDADGLAIVRSAALGARFQLEC